MGARERNKEGLYFSKTEYHYANKLKWSWRMSQSLLSLDEKITTAPLNQNASNESVGQIGVYVFLCDLAGASKQ